MSTAMTLDPPGSIAVVGAGPLGIEAALYGRFLGYDVTLMEAVAVASSIRPQAQSPLPLPPDRSLSPLAVGALQAQFPELATTTKPTTIGEWIEQSLERIIATDLLRGRLKCPARVVEIDTVDVEMDDADEAAGDEEELPPDFRLSITGIDSMETLDAESVILAVGESSEISLKFPTPMPYFFRIGEGATGNAEEDYWGGLKQIVAIYAALGGRPDLDLYRPRRH
jgi:hypothetical protein